MAAPVNLSPNSHWHLVQVFTIHQAACLWAGLEPASVSEWGKPPSDEFLAIKQMLSGAAVTGDLTVDSSRNQRAMIGNFSESYVSRSALEAFASRKRIYPKFLFDTLLPSTNAQPPQPPIPKPVSRGGRPPEYDWDSFTMEIIRIANAPDGLPDKQADLIGVMQSWFLETHGREPSDSNIKSKVSKIYNYIKQAKNSGA